MFTILGRVPVFNSLGISAFRFAAPKSYFSCKFVKSNVSHSQFSSIASQHAAAELKALFAERAPSFAVNADDVHVISSPTEFFESLKVYLVEPQMELNVS